ncbi:MAG TPA: hypothetical protein VFG21_04905 [Xanthomonadaceae bacterium]|nr:hypothetical protein [Xanthomonadaceae bacterium]
MNLGRVRAGLLAVLVAAALLSTPAAADWRREYDLGLRAVQSGDWAAAERHMRAALRDDGEPNAKKRFQGMRVTVYVPHYYAGLAEYRQGNCREALELWGHSPTRAVVQEAGLAAELSRYSGECETKLAAASRPATTVAQQPVATGAQSGPTTAPAQPASGTRTGPGTPATQPSTQPSRPAPTTVATTEKPPPRTTATPPPPRPQPAQPSAPRSAPPALRTAVDAYLGGRHSELAALDAARIDDTRARALALMLRAAARYGQGEREGDDKALATAREDVLAARRAAPSLALDESLFSPRFRAFVRATR